jgi:hypothetical protein
MFYHVVTSVDTPFTNGENVERRFVYSVFCVRDKPRNGIAQYIHIRKSYFKTSHCDIYKEATAQITIHNSTYSCYIFSDSKHISVARGYHPV